MTAWDTRRGFTVSITTMSRHAPWLLRLCRIHNRIAALCVTTGPGGTNAITGVVGGWLDSIPMLVLSGQVRYDTTARWSGVGIRAMGDQEFDICKAIDCMTKYSEMVIDPMRIRYCLEKALYLARSASGPLLAGYSPECPGRICGDRGASRL